MKFILFFLVGGWFLGSGVSAQDPPAFFDLLKPSFIKMGILPNLDGMLDGNLDLSFRWNSLLTTSAEANFSGSSEDSTANSDNVAMSAKTYSKNYGGDLRALELTLPWEMGEGSGLGLSAALACGYTGLNQSTSGYKTAQGETIFFNQTKMVHKIMPTLELGLTGVFNKAISLEANGAFLPYVLMLENGSKLYSTYDQEIPYILSNRCMGWTAKLRVATLEFPLGDISLKGALVGLFGNNKTRQDVVTGNFKTTIETYSLYRSLDVDLMVEYNLGFMKKILSLSPAVAMGYSILQESFDNQNISPVTGWKFGLTVSSK